MCDKNCDCPDKTSCPDWILRMRRLEPKIESKKENKEEKP